MFLGRLWLFNSSWIISPFQLWNLRYHGFMAVYLVPVLFDWSVLVSLCGPAAHLPAVIWFRADREHLRSPCRTGSSPFSQKSADQRVNLSWVQFYLLLLLRVLNSSEFIRVSAAKDQLFLLPPSRYYNYATAAAASSSVLFLLLFMQTEPTGKAEVVKENLSCDRLQRGLDIKSFIIFLIVSNHNKAPIWSITGELQLLTKTVNKDQNKTNCRLVATAPPAAGRQELLENVLLATY